MTVDVVELPGRTPLIVIEVPAFGDGDPADTVLLYGHLDKQPEMYGWREGLGPWTPVVEGDRLYGRGGADDGYAAFASLTAIEAVQRAGGSHSPLHRADRGQRGERLARPARPPRVAGRADRHAVAGALPRLRLQRLRAAVGHDVAAGAGRRHARRRHPGRRRPLRRGQRRRAEHVPHRPPAARPRRGRHDRRDPPRRAARPHPRRPPAPGRATPRPVDAPCTPPATTSSPAPAPWSTIRSSRSSTTRGGRRSPSSAPTACPRPRGRATCCGRPPRSSSRSACRPRATPTPRSTAVAAALTADPPYGARVDVRGPGGRAGLERARVRAVAGGGAAAGLAGDVRRPGPGLRRGRHHPVHGHARPALPRRPVRHHRACSGRTATPTAPTSTSTCRAAERITAALAMVLDDHARR